MTQEAAFDVMGFLRTPRTFEEICRAFAVAQPVVTIVIRSLERDQLIERGFIDADGGWLSDNDLIGEGCVPAWRRVEVQS